MKFKAKVIVTLKDKIKDAKGETVSTVLSRIGLESNSNMRMGKYFSFDINLSDNDVESCISEDDILFLAKKRLDKICTDVLSNPVMEKYLVLEFKKAE